MYYLVTERPLAVSNSIPTKYNFEMCLAKSITLRTIQLELIQRAAIFMLIFSLERNAKDKEAKKAEMETKFSPSFGCFIDKSLKKNIV